MADHIEEAATWPRRLIDHVDDAGLDEDELASAQFSEDDFEDGFDDTVTGYQNMLDERIDNGLADGGGADVTDGTSATTSASAPAGRP